MIGRHPTPFALARAFYEDLDAAGELLTDNQYRIFKAAFRRKIKEASNEQAHDPS